MPGHDIIVIGASAGGVDALKQLVKELPKDLPAALFVTLHIPGNGKSHSGQRQKRVAKNIEQGGGQSGDD